MTPASCSRPPPQPTHRAAARPIGRRDLPSECSRAIRARRPGSLAHRGEVRRRRLSSRNSRGPPAPSSWRYRSPGAGRARVDRSSVNALRGRTIGVIPSITIPSPSVPSLAIASYAGSRRRRGGVHSQHCPRGIWVGAAPTAMPRSCSTLPAGMSSSSKPSASAGRSGIIARRRLDRHAVPGLAMTCRRSRPQQGNRRPLRRDKADRDGVSQLVPPWSQPRAQTIATTNGDPDSYDGRERQGVASRSGRGARPSGPRRSHYGDSAAVSKRIPAPQLVSHQSGLSRAPRVFAGELSVFVERIARGDRPYPQRRISCDALLSHTRYCHKSLKPRSFVELQSILDPSASR